MNPTKIAEQKITSKFYLLLSKLSFDYVENNNPNSTIGSRENHAFNRLNSTDA